MNRLLIAALAASMLSGCAAAHLEIEMPPEGAPLEQRVAAYKKYRTKSHDKRTTYRMKRDQNGVETMRSSDTEYWMTLGDGQILYHPQDMLPAVGPRSETAQTVDELLDYTWPRAIVPTVGTGCLIAGAILGFTGSFGDPAPITLLSIAAVSYGVSWLFLEPKASELTQRSFATYDRDLMERLHLAREPDAVEPE